MAGHVETLLGSTNNHQLACMVGQETMLLRNAGNRQVISMARAVKSRETLDSMQYKSLI